MHLKTESQIREYKEVIKQKIAEHTQKGNNERANCYQEELLNLSMQFPNIFNNNEQVS